MPLISVKFQEIMKFVFPFRIVAFLMRIAFSQVVSDTPGSSSPRRRFKNKMNNERLRKAVEMWCKNKQKALDKYGPIEKWDTSEVTCMRELFKDKADFNEKIGGWDTSSVTNMTGMFWKATAFNRSLKFNTSKVTDMSGMFWGAVAFNQPLAFDTSCVTDMDHMFCMAEAFNQPLSFDTSKVTDMHGMFWKATAFNQPLAFDTSSVTNMSDMYKGAVAFNRSRAFDTKNVTDKYEWYVGDPCYLFDDEDDWYSFLDQCDGHQVTEWNGATIELFENGGDGSWSWEKYGSFTVDSGLFGVIPFDCLREDEQENARGLIEGGSAIGFKGERPRMYVKENGIEYGIIYINDVPYDSYPYDSEDDSD